MTFPLTRSRQAFISKGHKLDDHNICINCGAEYNEPYAFPSANAQYLKQNTNTNLTCDEFLIKGIIE